MSISCTATRVFTTNSINVNSGSWGIVSQNDGSYIFGWTQGSDDFPYDSLGSWLRSTDEGQTWSFNGNSDGLIGQVSAYHSNIHPNITVAPYFNPPTNGAGIIRTINQGISWTRVLDLSIAPSPHGRDVWIAGIQSYSKTHALAWGTLNGDNQNPPQTWGTSADAGATWTTHSAWDYATPFDTMNAMGIAEQGCWIASYTKGFTDPRFAWMANTTDFGATWNVGASMGGNNTPPMETGLAICCFDKLNAAMAGNHSNSPPDDNVSAWWTDDAAMTMHLVSNSDVINWPGGSGNMLCTEVKRLTQDACFLAFENQNDGTPGSCWRISLDKGHTYEIEVTQPSHVQTYQIPCGKAVVTKDGALLMALWQSNDYSTAEISLWRAPIICA